MPTESFSFRLPAAERQLLEEQAAGRSVSEVARRYIAEGVRRDRHPRVAFVHWRPGRPVLAGRPRLEVADVVETWQLSDRDAQATAEYLGISTDEVRVALSYNADFGDEIAAVLEEKRRLADRYEAIDRGGRREAAPR